jgi:ATP-dependent Lon protease
VAFPGALVPIDVARPSTLRGIDAALSGQPAFLAVFAQRASAVESPALADLHPTGCLCAVLFVHRPAQDPSHAAPGAGAWILLEGVRWVTLEGLDQVDPYYLARVADAPVAPSDAGTVRELDRTLRERARRLAATLPEIREQALAVIDATEDTAQLADLVMANLEGTVDDKAAYARETHLETKLERVLERLDAELAKSTPPG